MEVGEERKHSKNEEKLSKNKGSNLFSVRSSSTSSTCPSGLISGIARKPTNERKQPLLWHFNFHQFEDRKRNFQSKSTHGLNTMLNGTEFVLPVNFFVPKLRYKK